MSQEDVKQYGTKRKQGSLRVDLDRLGDHSRSYGPKRR